jgi:hypothetical protein
LQKSVHESVFKVVNSSDEVETESETLAAITITFRQDAKDFEPALAWWAAMP